MQIPKQARAHEGVEDLLAAAARAFPKISKRHFMFFSKSGYEKSVAERTAAEGAELLTVADLYRQ